MTTFNCKRHGDYPHDATFVANAWCPKCSLERGAITERLQQEFDEALSNWVIWQRDSGIPERGLRCTLSNWHPQGQAQQIASQIIARWVVDLSSRRNGRGLTLLGPPGVGKTHLCYALTTEAYAQGVRARYAVWNEVINRHKATFGDNNSADRNLLDHLKRAPFLVLDEIGAGKTSLFDQGLLFEIVDSRYSRLLPTIVASNLTVDLLGAIGEGASDRLAEMNEVICLPGDSQRGGARANFEPSDRPLALVGPTSRTVLFDASINGRLVSQPIHIQRTRL